MKNALCFSHVLFCLICSYYIGLSPNSLPLFQDFDTETLITNYSERITYDDLAIEAVPLAIFNFHIPNETIDPLVTQPLMFLIDILYIADVHNVDTDELIETGIAKIKLLFFINDGDFYCTMRYKTDFTFDQNDKTFVGRSVIRYLEPVFDRDSHILSFRIQNSAGNDAFDSTSFVPKGILRHQVAFVKYNYNTPTELHFFGEVTINNKVVISPTKHLFFDRDTVLNAHFNMFQFARANEPLISIAANSTVITNNIIFEDFSPQHVSFALQSALIFGDGTTIELGKNEELTMTWTFKGTCILNGRGQSLTLGKSGKIVVDGLGSSLLCDNIMIKGVSSKNICCLDDSCTLSFRCSSIVLRDDFVFDTGKFVVLDELKVRGQKIFNYTTDQPSIISADSCLCLDRNCEFHYNPPVADKSLLKMADSSALLHLNGATLNVSTTGLDLSQGTLVVENKCFLHNEGTVCLSEGIVVNEVDILAGASLNLDSGILDVRQSAS